MRTLAVFQSPNFTSCSSSSSSIPQLSVSPVSFLPINHPTKTLLLNKKNNFEYQSSTNLSSHRSRLLVPRSQKQPENNVSEESDEMFDDLFDKYGKVVYRSGDQKPPTDEADDDAECLAFAIAMAKEASEVKAADIRLLFVKPLVYWTRFFIIVTAFSRPQIYAIASRIKDLAEEQYNKVPTGDFKPNSWTLLDFGDVVIHIMLPPQREYYNLEDFYANATSIELPFESQSSPRN
ncbi:hypothetical protein MKX01_014992 [Papaver californicum]|nr:hypothetical protein MKX01_014992 [Papaver californicum]